MLLKFRFIHVELQDDSAVNGYMSLTPCSTIFQLYPIVVVSFVGGVKWNTARKPQSAAYH